MLIILDVKFSSSNRWLLLVPNSLYFMADDINHYVYISLFYSKPLICLPLIGGNFGLRT